MIGQLIVSSLAAYAFVFFSLKEKLNFLPVYFNDADSVGSNDGA